ncbi:serine/threonine-protein kinase ATM [Eutrema salsugineum]|uniref:serine/threonine-protein kinase ATM n=1 Tax=Eutrema salsugineum TaxID=72664 RepID=UPI000CED24CB|nr:serine/threonine-protein kinase ATM [Eutrema salsugineum]
MGNFVTTDSRVSENGVRAVSGHIDGCSDDNLKGNDVKMESVNDAGPIEDYAMSEASSLLNTKQDSRVNCEEEEEINNADDEEENGFRVGDFVWVREVNSHQWWPGKVYDSSDASDLALKQMHKGKLLVAYFWKETFAWCYPAQLKPFIENFREFSKTSGSKSFVRAVEEAVVEIGEHVEHLLVPDEDLVSRVAVNSGVKKGVLVPDVRKEVVSSLVLENPGIVLEDVERLAKTVSFSDLLEIEVLKRKISAFYRSKGRFGLAQYDEHRYIIGLEDKDDEYALDFSKSSWQRALRKCSALGGKKRKYGDEAINVDLADVATTGSTTLRRRLSEVSKNENSDLKQVEETRDAKSFSSRKRKNKRGLEDEDEDGVEKREESNDSNHLEECEKKEDSGMETPMASLCKRLRSDVSSSVERNNGSGETTVQTGKRERKKSKYLSPEYMTDFGWGSRKSKMTKNAAEKALDFVSLEAAPEEVLNLIRSVALDTQYVEDYNSSCDMITEFVSIYRSFTYHDGANHKRNISEEDKQPELKQQVVDEKETVKKMNKRELEEQFSSVELVIKSGFGPSGATLPSKDDLIRTYEKFGALDKNRSCMFDNNSCARVYFLNVSDGEEAFRKSLKKCPFATTSTVTFKLQFPSSDSPENTNEKKEAEIMEIECLKKKLEEMRALLDQSQGEVTQELKMKLEDESRNFLDKVRKMSVNSS